MARFQTRTDARRTLIDEFDRVATKVSTGLPTLDRAMGGGMFVRRLYAFQARKKTGKTTLMQTIAYNLAKAKVTTLWIACEMSASQLEHNLLARDLAVNPIALLHHKDGALKERIARVRQDTEDHIVYADAPLLRLSELEDLVATAVKHYGVKGFFLDYYQLVRGGGVDHRVQHLEDVAQMLAGLVRKHDLFGVCAAQLNIEGLTRGGEGLKLAADQVYTLHRDRGRSEAWLELEDTRYTPHLNVGSKTKPGLILVPEGMYFREADPTPLVAA